MTSDHAAPAPSDDTLGARVARLARAVHGDATSNGDRAALKRWATGQTIPLTFYRLWLRFVDDELPEEPVIPAWMMLAWGLATLGAKGHRPDRTFGSALAHAGYASARLERLMDAPMDVLPDLFAGAVRYLASKGEAFDWREPAALLLARHAASQDAARRRIAVAYYRQLPKE